MSGRVRNWLLIGLQIAVSVALIAYLADTVTMQDFTQATRLISISTFAQSVALLAVNHLIGTYRLKIVLSALGVRISFRRSVTLTWLGLFASNFLPSTIGGDALIAALLRRHRNPLAQIVTGLILNRAASVIALATVLPCLLLIRDLDVLRPLILQCIFWIVFFLCLAGLGFALLRWLFLKSAALEARLGRMRDIGIDLCRQILAIKPAFLAAWFLSLVMLLFGSASVAVLAESQGLSTSLPAIFGVVLIFLAVQMIPVSFNGIGLQESVITFCFVNLGWPIASALALSVCIRLTAIVISLPGIAIAAKMVAGLLRHRSSENLNAK